MASYQFNYLIEFMEIRSENHRHSPNSGLEGIVHGNTKTTTYIRHLTIAVNA